MVEQENSKSKDKLIKAVIAGDIQTVASLLDTSDINAVSYTHLTLPTKRIV